MKEINYKEFSWEVIPSEDGKEISVPHTNKETTSSFEDAVDAWKLFTELTSGVNYDVSWDLSETPDVLTVTIFDVNSGIKTTVRKWDTWDEDIETTYGIHYLFSDTNVELFHDKTEWENRIKELDPEFPWEPAIPLMVYVGKNFIATADYSLKRKEND
jgi:hypothetical protein